MMSRQHVELKESMVTTRIVLKVNDQRSDGWYNPVNISKDLN